jgi:hypothetical protein
MILLESEQISTVARLRFAMRTLWVVLQAGAAYMLAEQVSPFFYQQF